MKYELADDEGDAAARPDPPTHDSSPPAERESAPPDEDAPSAAAGRAEAWEFLEAHFGAAETGYLNLFTRPGNESHWVPVANLEQAVDRAALLARTHDVYVAAGLHAAARASTERGTAEHVSAIPALWADLDFRGDAHRASNLPPALADVLALVRAFPLAPSTLIHTGHGVQVYWLFKEPWMLERPEERRAAQNLVRRLQRWFQEAARANGWRVDSTHDLARVLRLPGTMNRKPGLDPVPVRLLHLDGRLRYNPDDFDWLPPAEEESAAPGRDKCGAIRPLHGPGATPLLAPILNGCAWMRHCRDDAAALGEPEWYAMLGIAGRCRDGAAAAHALSRRYPGYSPQETAEKLSHALEAAGPRTCQSIRSDLDAEPYCAACPHQGKIRSPIVLGMRAADRPPAPTDADAPPERVSRCKAATLAASAAEGLPECGQGPLIGTPPRGGSLHPAGLARTPISSPPLGESRSAPPTPTLADGREAEASFTPRDEDDPEPEKRGAGSFDQLRYARRFAAAFTGKLLFVDGEQWWEYQENHWRYAGVTVARARMQHFLMDQPAIPSRQITAGRVKATLELAGPLLGPVRVDELNPHRDWIPLRNVVYDTGTGRVFPHSPEHRFTYCLPYDYDPAAQCPTIDSFFRQVLIREDGRPCAEWIELLEEWFGVCSTTDNRAQASLVFVGEGQNGKGVATRLLQRFVGVGQHTAIDVEMLHDPYHRAALVGKLVGFINEPSRRALEKNGGVVKAISGGDEISARNPCERVFSFLPATRLVISCNSLPATRDLSRGYFRRLLLIEWRFQPAVPDPALDEKLAAELSGLFNRAMAGLRRYRERGCRFPDLPESEHLKADYQKSQDVTALFLDDVCRRDPERAVAVSELYRAFDAWRRAKGYRADQDEHAFGRRLTQLGLPKSEQRKKPGGVNHKVRAGIDLNQAALQAALGPEAWRRFSGPHGPTSAPGW